MKKFLVSLAAAAMLIASLAGPTFARGDNWTCENPGGGTPNPNACKPGNNPNDWVNPGGKTPPGQN